MITLHTSFIDGEGLTIGLNDYDLTILIREGIITHNPKKKPLGITSLNIVYRGTQAELKAKTEELIASLRRIESEKAAKVLTKHVN